MCLLATFFIEMSLHFWLSYLYILEINSLSIALFANIFSPCVAFFYLLIVSFAVQKLLSLIAFHLFIFVYVYSHFIDFHWLSNLPNTPC